MATQNSINFSITALSNLVPPKTGRDIYSDIKTPGLKLRVTPSGVKSFSFYKRLKGAGPERIGIGRFPDISIDKAREMASEISLKISQGVNPVEIKRAKNAEYTFDDLFAEYLKRHAKPRKQTADEDENRYKRHVQPVLGSKKLSSIDRQTITNLHRKITNSGHPTGANRILSLISSVFGRGIEWSITETNPALGIRRNPEKSRDRFLMPHELPKFFRALAQEPNEVIRDYIHLSLLTGARRANVLAMKWVELDLKDCTWTIPKTKNGTSQNVTLSPEAVVILKSREKKAAKDAIYVFPADSVSGHLVEPRKGWARILKSAGLADLRIHDLRRTLGSWQAREGASLSIIGKSLNHKSHQTTAIYARLDLDPVRASIEKATRAMVEAGKQPEVQDVNKPQGVTPTVRRKGVKKIHPKTIAKRAARAASLKS